MSSNLRELPSVDAVLMDDQVRSLAGSMAPWAVADLVREVLERARTAAVRGAAVPTAADVSKEVVTAASAWRSWPRSVINATGVVLHTNLGRAPLSQAAVSAASTAASAYGDLEYDLKSGIRGSRQAVPGELLRRVTRAEAAIVVNNNASAVLLGLSALAGGKQVITSRGEAVEIGGGFRVPDVLRASGAELVEVGTTNRTYAQDFERAISEHTGAILAVHASNFRTVGFTHAPSLAELVDLGSRYSVPVLHDLGSGCLLDTSMYGLAHEPTPQESLGAGVDVAFFSADKLLGGPQAGLIVGKRQPVTELSGHPLARAVRADKMTLAALSETLLHYLRGEAEREVPIWRMISAADTQIEERAQELQRSAGSRGCVVPTRSTVGGGSLPGETLPSWAVSIEPGSGGADALTAALRRGNPPIIGRIEDGRVLLDPRTVLPEQGPALKRGLRAALEVA